MKIPASVKKIGRDAFEKCTKLRTAEFSEGLTEIERTAFKDCVSLEKISFPSSLRVIEGPHNMYRWLNGAFSNCTALTDVEFLGKDVQIGSYTFCDCKALKSIEFHGGPRMAEESAFKGTPLMRKLSAGNGDFRVINGVLLSYTGKKTTAEIPDGVRTIGIEAFKGNKTLKTVVIPESVTEIGKYAFAGCRSLEQVNIPAGVTAINEGVFSDCESLTEIVIPENVTEIAKYAFNGCLSLESVTVPKGVTVISKYAFCDCESLENITLPDGITSIKEGAFSGCGFKNIDLPDGITGIETETFKNCRSLTEIKIPRGVKTIAQSAFEGCRSLSDITLHEEIEEIEGGAFRGCGLKKLELSEKVRTVYCIADNRNIDRYFFPKTCIEGFELDDKINYIIYFLSSVRDHSECEKEYYMGWIKKQKKKVLEAVYNGKILSALDGLMYLGVLTIKDIDDYIELANKDKNTEILAMLMDHKHKSFTAEQLDKEEDRKLNRAFNKALAPPTVEELKKIWDFEKLPDRTLTITGYKGNDADITIPAVIGRTKVTQIKDSAFSGNKKLKSVTVPEGITAIGYGAFSGCTKLADVTLPDSLTAIGEYAFSGCANLKKITVPAGVKEIGIGAFGGCANLTEINAHPDSKNFCSEDGILFSKNKKTLALYPAGKSDTYAVPEKVAKIGDGAFCGTGIKNISLHEGITDIGECAFADCAALEAITIPESVRKICKSAFSSCTGLRELTIPEGIEKIENYAFSDCAALESVTVPGSIRIICDSTFSGCTGLKSVNICEGIEEIESEAFYHCESLENIVLPKSLRRMKEGKYRGSYAFCGCTGLKELTIPEGVKEIGEGAFYECTGLKKLTISEGVEKIGEGAFEYCAGLEELTIPKSVKEIGREAFCGCNGLKKLTISEGVEKIGSGAFEDCTGLESVTLPGSLKNIGSIFSGCKGLKSVIISEGTEKIGQEAFKGCVSLVNVTLPKSLKKIDGNQFWTGHGAFCGCVSLESIAIPDGVSISGNAFEGCKKLKRADIPAGVEKIESNAFTGCDKLVIYTPEGSFAEKFAKENNISCNGEKRQKPQPAEPAQKKKRVADAKTFAADISAAPTEIIFEGKVFVHTNCVNENELEAFIADRGGEIKSSMTAKTDYLIIGDFTRTETVKISKAADLKEKGKNIIALTESQFSDLTGYGK